MRVLIDGDCAMCVVANQRLTASANLAVAAEAIAEAAAKKAAGAISASDDGSMDDDDEEEEDDESSDDDWLDWSNDGAVTVRG
jgi:hypothetical protein